MAIRSKKRKTRLALPVQTSPHQSDPQRRANPLQNRGKQV